MSFLVEEITDGNAITAYVVELSKAREGLVPIRKTVTRKGKTYEQVFYVRPKDLRTMTAENASNFMTGMVKAQTHFKNLLDTLDKHLPEAASAVYDKMKASGQKMIKVGELQMEVADYSRQNPVGGDNLLAAIHSRPEAEIPSQIKNIVSDLYKSITTTTFGEQLKIGGTGRRVAPTVRVSEAQKPHTWTATGWASKLKGVLSNKVNEIKGLLGLRAALKIPSEEVAKEKKKKKVAEKSVTHYLDIGGQHGH